MTDQPHLVTSVCPACWGDGDDAVDGGAVCRWCKGSGELTYVDPDPCEEPKKSSPTQE
jgi:DnaJ-class molecular chaperone